MDIQTILSQIDLGSYALPTFQRGYVWNRNQVRNLMSSLYRGYPIGQLQVWDTATDPSIARGGGPLTPGHVNLILDGQQRITSLYGVIRGHAPRFFDGNADAFTNLYFNVEEESFEFYMAAKMRNNPAWIGVTELMQKGASVFLQERVQANPEAMAFWMAHMAVLNNLDAIQKRDIYVQTVSGADKTIDVVVDIFNNLNSGGTQLSKGDLALAKLCGEWTDARSALNAILQKYAGVGYDFRMDWLLRCVTVYMTGQPYFNPLGQVTAAEFRNALPETDKLIGTCLDHIGTRLGLDHDRVMGGVFAIPTMIGYLRHRGGRLSGGAEWDKLLYWYVHSFLWGRYTGSVESKLAQDLHVIADGQGIEGLVRMLRQSRGDLTVRPEDFWGWSTGARFYPLLYLLTRTNHARDWGTNLELNAHLLGRNSSMEVHHIFPKDVLYRAGKTKSIVNSLANYAFLTKDTNLEISNQCPEQYMPIYRQRCPGALESHWIPMDPALWKLENYEAFLDRRRALLAEAANALLDSLWNGIMAMPALPPREAGRKPFPAGDEDAEIGAVSAWMAEHGLERGTPHHELVDDAGSVIAIIDLAWPHGVQPGLSEPMALLLDETADVQAAVSRSGYRFFTDAAEFKRFVERAYLS